jgi:hypothetical protein
VRVVRRLEKVDLARLQVQRGNDESLAAVPQFLVAEVPLQRVAQRRWVVLGEDPLADELDEA